MRDFISEVEKTLLRGSQAFPAGPFSKGNIKVNKLKWQEVVA
jgi:hypothetical protein